MSQFTLFILPDEAVKWWRELEQRLYARIDIGAGLHKMQYPDAEEEILAARDSSGNVRLQGSVT